MYDLLRQLPGFTVKGIEMNSYLEEVKATALAEAQKTYMAGWLVGLWQRDWLEVLLQVMHQ